MQSDVTFEVLWNYKYQKSIFFLLLSFPITTTAVAMKKPFFSLFYPFGSRTLFMSQQWFIAFMTQEFFGQALNLGWVFTYVSRGEFINFTVCRLVKNKLSFPTIFFFPPSTFW